MIVQIRPFQLVNTLVLVILSSIVHQQDSNYILMGLIWFEYFLVTIFALLVNDYLHRFEDQKMGRTRLFSKFQDKSILILFLLSTLFIIIIIALISGLITLIIILTDILIAFIYGFAKQKGKVIVSLILRFLHGLLLYLGISSFYFLFDLDIIIMIFIGLFDLFVHLSGDLRDFSLDLLVNRSTFPILYGTKLTYLIMIILNFGSILFFLVSGIGQHEANYTIIIFSSTGWVFFIFLNLLSDTNSWFHACFHSTKVLTYLVFGLTFDHNFETNLFVHISALIVIFILWLLSYYAYLWADNQI